MYRTTEPKPRTKKLAVDLGVHPEALRGWIRRAEADAGERDDCLSTGERAGLTALRKENSQLKRANDVLRTASAFFAAQLAPTRPRLTALVDEHPRLGAECVLWELRIPSSTCYRWRRAEKEPCERRRRDVELAERIKEIHAESGGNYGSPRVHAVLRREGTHVGRKRVERLMREAGIAGTSPRRKGFTRRDPKTGLAPDLVNRDFTAPAPNRLWVTGLTMVSTGEGPLWLSAIRDAFSRRVVAWETSARADADLVLATLEYALASREVEPGKLIHHTDHGCQYTSTKLTTRLMQAGVEASMGSVGDSCDNALAENLSMLIQTECIRGRTYTTRAETNLALFEYIDGFYNSRRTQERLGFLSPIEFEEKYYAKQATAEPTNLNTRQPLLTS
ncbi:IS3 family transposase [Streptomyces sp. NBC_01429]|uniref:IS3 family transposase n=1 Tax=Streptomyces sp. NBC_01429 TaxID=2903862 RepID=UPI002E290BD0|nr:IS3 family transposase [Streptomyces sp. NBC_01429]